MNRIYADIFFKEDADIVDCLQLCKKLKTNRLIKNVFCSASYEKPHQSTTHIEIDDEMLTQPTTYSIRSQKQKNTLKRLARASLASSKNEDIRNSALKYLARSRNPICKKKDKEETSYE